MGLITDHFVLETLSVKTNKSNRAKVNEIDKGSRRNLKSLLIKSVKLPFLVHYLVHRDDIVLYCKILTNVKKLW